MPDSVTIPENAQEGFINANGVILRGGPSASAVILNTFDSGTRVAILGTENGWTEVVVNGQSGYIKSDYVTRGNYIGSNAGSTAADYGSGAVYINNGTGNGMVIVPDSPVLSGNNNPSLSLRHRMITISLVLCLTDHHVSSFTSAFGRRFFIPRTLLKQYKEPAGFASCGSFV